MQNGTHVKDEATSRLQDTAVPVLGKPKVASSPILLTVFLYLCFELRLTLTRHWGVIDMSLTYVGMLEMTAIS